MSGIKYSQIALEQERQSRLDCLRSLDRCVEEQIALHQAIDIQQAQILPGHRSTFPHQVANLAQWRQQSAPEDRKAYNEQVATPLLADTVQRYEQWLSQGRTALQAVQHAIYAVAPGMATELRERLERIEQHIHQHRAVVAKWSGESIVTAWEQGLQTCQNNLHHQELSMCAANLTPLEQDINTQTQMAEAVETEQQRRLYLLKALRQCCADFQFTEVDPPVYAEAANPRSAIHLRVNTHNRGTILFQIKLDCLISHADMSTDHCPLEFDKLAADLEAQFGFKTTFRSANPEAVPRLRQRGELEEPTGVTQQQTLAR